MTIRTLIVDDEPNARDWVKKQLADHPDVEVVGECGDGLAAVKAIEEIHPDLVFLDVQMPGLDGMGVLQAMTDRPLPVVVFVTAYDQYAVRAFDANALDYILKPFGRERVREALQRARSRLGADLPDPVRRRVESYLSDIPARRDPLRWYLVRSNGKSVFVRTQDIDWIEAARNNVKLHVGKEIHVFRETMNTLETKLDPALFLRIHRSTIVNLNRAREVHPWFNGEVALVLADGTRLTVGGSYKSRLKGFRKPGH